MTCWAPSIIQFRKELIWAIPNVPLDITAFGETALVYGALIGQAPTKAEVAKLTLTPEFTVRPLAERARLIWKCLPMRAGMAWRCPRLTL